MHESIAALLLCGGTGGGAMRARAVCVHAALKLVANLLTKYENDGDRQAAIDVSHSNAVPTI